MADDYLNKYKEEDSVSSASGDDGVEVIKRTLANTKLSSQSEQPQIVEEQEKKVGGGESVALYTFDPRSVIESVSDAATSRPYSSVKPFDKPIIQFSSPARDYGITNFKVARETKFTSPISARYTPSSLTQYSKDLDYPQVGARNEPLRSFQYGYKDETKFADFKSENDYRAFAKEFDNEFGDRQRDSGEVQRQLGSRVKRLQMLARDFSAPNADLGLLRTRLLHELETTQSDLNDASNAITLLMNDRMNIKDKYCHLKLRNKQSKSFEKVFEENIRA
eukprot:TRINITY_DN7334_c0_g1_i1.p1 TRINITY_DN7334_c0_g1~~TRINITY_DN7334_c0_g1_i1.p1  ORF type:complete len:278 (+),score=87.59 TRINITY_DN7334_c0_g1_i1:1237-2070(+)